MHKQQAPLLLEPKPSSRLKQAIIAAHLIAATASISNALPMIIKAILLAACAAHLYLSLNRPKTTSAKIKHSDKADWEISTNDNVFDSVQIQPTTVISTFMVILHFVLQNGDKRTLIIANDALTKDDYRRFVVRLKTSIQTHR